MEPTLQDSGWNVHKLGLERLLVIAMNWLQKKKKENLDSLQSLVVTFTVIFFSLFEYLHKSNLKEWLFLIESSLNIQCNLQTESLNDCKCIPEYDQMHSEFDTIEGSKVNNLTFISLICVTSPNNEEESRPHCYFLNFFLKFLIKWGKCTWLFFWY